MKKSTKITLIDGIEVKQDELTESDRRAIRGHTTNVDLFNAESLPTSPYTGETYDPRWGYSFDKKTRDNQASSKETSK